MSSTPWHDMCMRWFRKDPQGFLDLFFHGQARFCHELPPRLESEEYEVDLLMEVEVVETGQHVLVHFEFQTYYDPTMAERMLGYNINAYLKYKKPVISVVWHLMDDTAIEPSPLVVHVPMNKDLDVPIFAFAYMVIEVGRLTPQKIRELGHNILLPLLPLTKGGMERGEILTMVEMMQAHGLQDLQAIGLAFAALKLERKRPAELAWLHGRFFTMLREILRESPFIQWFIEEGMEKGIEKGIEKGRAEVALVVEQLVRLRFPVLQELAQQCLAGCHDLEHLGQLAVKLGVAQNVEEARLALLGMPDRQAHGELLPPS